MATVPTSAGDPVPVRGKRQAPRRVAVLFASAALAVFGVLLSLRVGTVPLSWHAVLTGLFDYPGKYHGKYHVSHEQFVVHVLYLPRAVFRVTAGMAFAVAGALMQGLTRNQMADAGLLGINAGAELVITLSLLLKITSLSAFVWFSFAGAAAAGVIVYALGSVGGGATPIKLTLAGAILATFIGSITSLINQIYREQIQQAQGPGGGQYSGGVAAISLGPFWQVAPYLAVGLLLALGSGKALNGLSLGEEVARSLGQHIARTRTLVSLSVVLLAGSAVALAGPIAFLGLIAPHLARRLMGPDYRWVIPATALLGAGILLLADVAGRTVHTPWAGETDAGTILAILGGPLFIFLARSKRAGTL